MKTITSFLVLISLLFSVNSYASTEVVVDLKKLSPDVAASVLKEMNNSNNEIEKTIPEPDKLKKYTDVGLAIGSALKEVCKTLSIEVNEFIKTPAGMIITGLIIYKCGGKDILKLIIMGIFCFISFIVISCSLYWFLSKKRVIITKDGKIKTYEYIQRYTFKSNDGKSGCVTIHIISYILIFLVFIITIASL